MVSTDPPPVLVADRVYADLRERIVSGELAAGARLRVRDVAADVGTSVMPVREAIRRLEEAGLVDRAPHRGATVRGVTLRDLLQIYDLRILLEAEAAAHGCRGLDDAAVDEMQAHLESMWSSAEAGDVVGALDRDEDLLRTLYRAAGNRFLLDLVEDLWRRCRVFKVLGASAAHAAGDPSPWAPQEHLVAAARRRDAGRASELTREALVSARRRVEAQIAAPAPTAPVD